MPDPTSETARALAESERFAAAFDRSRIPATPSRGIAVLACMDARIHVEQVLGLQTGEAHIIRNAGGLATDDAIRSLVVSRRLLGTREILVIEHTGCGLIGIDEEEVRASIAGATGEALDLPLHAFADLDANLRAQVERIKAHPWIGDVPVTGLVYHVETGRLRLVTEAGADQAGQSGQADPSGQ